MSLGSLNNEDEVIIKVKKLRKLIAAVTKDAWCEECSLENIVPALYTFLFPLAYLIDTKGKATKIRNLIPGWLKARYFEYQRRDKECQARCPNLQEGIANGLSRHKKNDP